LWSFDLILIILKGYTTIHYSIYTVLASAIQMLTT